MSEINFQKEKSWGIKDKFPINVYVEKSWTGTYFVITAPSMSISYGAWEDLDSNREVDISTYDYENGNARWTSYTLDQIKKWGEKNKDKIIINQ
jgi:hypothetical protein